MANVSSWHKASSLDVRSHGSCWRRSGHGSARVKPTLLTYTCQSVDEFAAMRSSCIGPHKKACCGGGVSLKTLPRPLSARVSANTDYGSVASSKSFPAHLHEGVAPFILHCTALVSPPRLPSDKRTDHTELPGPSCRVTAASTDFGSSCQASHDQRADRDGLRVGAD